MRTIKSEYKVCYLWSPRGQCGLQCLHNVSQQLGRLGLILVHGGLRKTAGKYFTLQNPFTSFQGFQAPNVCCKMQIAITWLYQNILSILILILLAHNNGLNRQQKSMKDLCMALREINIAFTKLFSKNIGRCIVTITSCPSSV